MAGQTFGVPERLVVHGRVVIFDTERLVKRHAEAITLCAFSSGSALYPNAPRREPDTFARIEDYPYEDHRRRHGRANALVEVCVTGQLEEIEDVVEQVVRIESDGTSFQRLDDRETTPGVGLGPAVAKGFVDAMGGTIRAEDTPGGGPTIVISLPAAA